jgi:hypothetical protein
MFQELVDRLGSGQLFVLLIITLALASGIVKCIADQWRKVREAEMEAALKQDMLNRGMSAQEIQMVLSAKGSKASCEINVH